MNFKKEQAGKSVSVDVFYISMNATLSHYHMPEQATLSNQ